MTYTIFIQGNLPTSENLLRDVLGSPIGSFAWILGVMILGGWLIYYVTKHVTKFKCDREDIGTKHVEIKGSIEKVKDKLDEKLEAINRDISFIKGSLDVIRTTGVSNDTVASHSPISLTPTGKDIANELGLEGIIASNWDKIYSYLENNGMNAKNAYDIQQFCMETATISLDNFFSEKDINKIKTFAFEKGKLLAYYGPMIGVMIRDAYFKHKGINPLEVDKHTPDKK